eukprot:jgi/Picsp_1/6346/NSC_03695-R1_expressed protein [Chlorella variabilis]
MIFCHYMRISIRYPSSHRHIDGHLASRCGQLRVAKKKATSITTPVSLKLPHTQFRVCAPLYSYQNDEESTVERQIEEDERRIFLGSAVLTVLAFAGVALLPRSFDQGLEVGAMFMDGEFSSGDLIASLLWSVAYYFCTPLQLLLLFFGRFETERPSDWIVRIVGRFRQLPVDALGYEAPMDLRILSVMLAITWGILTAAVFELALEDSIWGISAGVGACFAAALFEVGRPERLSPEQAKKLETQWQDFKEFADNNLQRQGRIHENELIGAFRKRSGKYRTEEQLEDARIKDMIKNWNSEVKRSRTGWLKNISFRAPQPE